MDAKQFAGDKILRHKERIDEFFSSGYSKPITAEFDMTNICNHDCPFCFGYYKRKENVNHISKEDAMDVLSQMKEIGVKAVTFTGGGDPLVNRNTVDSIEYASSLGMDVALITNGLALNEDYSKRLVKICKWIRISVDADSPETYLKTHGVGEKAWKKMLDNLRFLVNQKKEIKSDCTIGVGYLTMPETVGKEKMISFVKLFRKIGVDYSQFRPLMPLWNEPKTMQKDDSLPLILECLKESTKEYDVLYSKPKYDLMDKPIKEWRPYDKCLGVNFTLTVSADMKVYVCCHHRGIEKYCLGNLKKEKLKEIWDKRQETFDRIDFRDCPYLCRNNPFNIVLWNIKTKKQKIEEIKEKRKHENFL